MPLTPRPLSSHLDEISARTLGHYAAHAAYFWDGTRNHDVTENYHALLGALPGVAPRRILDLGCGPGRDLVALRDAGESPTGLDGCAEFVEMARAYSGCEVIEQDFLKLELPPASFEGVFANASLFHVPRAQLGHVLGVLFRALVPGGVLFCSNPRAISADAEGWNGERYGCYLTSESWSNVIASAGFVLESQYLRPSGRPPSEQPWLAMVWRKPRS